MREKMVHRGPDGAGDFVDQAQGIAMAMRRLAIIDREGGDQPIANETGDVVVVYNGEIYNHRALRAELEGKGHVFRTRADTEVIVHLYEEEGLDAIARLDGMFAFSLWDARKNVLVVARDRFGVKPLYYALQGARLSWSSEIVSLLEDSAVPRDLDWRALETYLALYYIPSPQTIYAAVRALRPAHYIVASGDQVKIRRYWTPRYSTWTGSEEEAEEAIRGAVEAAVRSTLESEVPLGAFLSGGLDSTAIAAFAQNAQGRLKTYSLGFEDDLRFDERALARAVASRYGTNHTECVLRADEVPAILDRLVRCYGQPFGDWSAVLNYKIAAVAKETATVILRGDGGDELFGGYPTLIASRFNEAWMRLPGFIRRGVAAAVEAIPASSGYMSLDFKLKRFVRGVRNSTEEAHLGWKEIFDRARRIRLCPALAEHKRDVFDELVTPLGFDIPDASLMDRLLYIDLRIFLEGCGLVTSDHVAMAHSIETRVPFLTNALADLAFSLPFSYKVRGARTKYILRRAMKPILPPEVLAAPKRGFTMPAADWIRGPLRETVLETLGETPAWLDRAVCREVLDAHISGRRDATREISALVNLVRWDHSRN